MARMHLLVCEQKHGKYYCNEIAYEVWWHTPIFLFNRQSIRGKEIMSSSNSYRRRRREEFNWVFFFWEREVFPPLWSHETARKQRFNLIDNEHNVISAVFLVLPLPVSSDGWRLFCRALTALGSAHEQIMQHQAVSRQRSVLPHVPRVLWFFCKVQGWIGNLALYRGHLIFVCWENGDKWGKDTVLGELRSNGSN